ncbi:hypothetical protein A2154_04380 [Candidatus Gottesmanbacteria bacterium RBG_16_43_7]|uniref:FAD-binding FR-type domain-containing protein n=1 Tax=Candidatus Gottesmanbacteria bacterium RBG_16_43_7 TaxID=1798373 RepID=A0A1F5ZCA6_9BACT|nr:MAG: hypothetical protein A2154_04380 [Candidatus Gottesmanbacteria bacterium RBG_16_43_7]
MSIYSKPQKCIATVSEKIQLTKTTYLAKYKLNTPESISFIAGQTIMISVAPGVHRAMSIASPPQETDVITSIQDVAPGGPGSKWMEYLKVGDTLEFTGPLGRFVIDHASTRKQVLVATGTGIAPFRSMLLDKTNGASTCEPMSLYWGLRHKEDIYLYDEIKHLDEEREQMEFFLTLSQPPDDWDGLRGYVNGHVIEHEKDLSGCDFYLCGNKHMIMDMQKALSGKGIPRSQMKFDPFY